MFKRLMAVNQSPSVKRDIVADDGTTIRLDYLEERMEKPYRGKLRRQFQKGLWLQVKFEKKSDLAFKRGGGGYEGFLVGKNFSCPHVRNQNMK